MSTPTNFVGSVHVQGTLSCGTLTLPANSVRDASVSASDPLGVTKTDHRHAVIVAQPWGTAVVARSEVAFIATGPCTVSAVRVGIDAVPSGGDLAYAVDIQKSTGGGAWASILTGTVAVTSSDTARSVKSGTLSGTPTLVAGDMLRVNISVSGSTGTQGQGVAARITVDEEPV